MRILPSPRGLLPLGHSRRQKGHFWKRQQLQNTYPTLKDGGYTSCLSGQLRWTTIAASLTTLQRGAFVLPCQHRSLNSWDLSDIDHRRLAKL